MSRTAAARSSPTAARPSRSARSTCCARSEGYEPDHMSETIFARMPTPEEMESLELPAGEPVMILTRRTYTSDDVLIEFARGVHAASRFSWTYDFKLPE
ncbi:UTRA domain-containing protein [Nocardia sp. NPDC004151]|uniref:UTRA domain-containing protein n=1 Tax=Nocardia sp. NPDC004151 TaxID=3364304 RepID=UPI0036C3CCB3